MRKLGSRKVLITGGRGATGGGEKETNHVHCASRTSAKTRQKTEKQGQKSRSHNQPPFLWCRSSIAKAGHRLLGKWREKKKGNRKSVARDRLRVLAGKATSWVKQKGMENSNTTKKQKAAFHSSHRGQHVMCDRKGGGKVRTGMRGKEKERSRACASYTYHQRKKWIGISPPRPEK